MIKKRLICIGASAGAIACINKLKMLDPEREILCFSAESEQPYNKCLLADWLSDKKTESQVVLTSHEQLRQKGIIFHQNTPISQIKPEEKAVFTSSGERWVYDDLLIATGSRPFIPSIVGLSGDRVFTFHTASDTRDMDRFIREQSPRRALVIGAGLTGLEAADALLSRGVGSITVLEKSDRLMGELIPKSASDFLANRMASLKVSVECNKQVISVHTHQRELTAIYSSGEAICVDMIIVATGVRSNSELAQKAGIACERSGIIVNQFMQTSVAHIYAAGDVALVSDQITQDRIVSRTWPDAMAQGMTAAHAIAGVPKPYPGVVMSLNSAFFGLKFASSYASLSLDHNQEALIIKEGPEPSYGYIMTSQGVVTGYCLMGDTSRAPVLRRSLVTKQPLL